MGPMLHADFAHMGFRASWAQAAVLRAEHGSAGQRVRQKGIEAGSEAPRPADHSTAPGASAGGGSNGESTGEGFRARPKPDRAAGPAGPRHAFDLVLPRDHGSGGSPKTSGGGGPDRVAIGRWARERNACRAGPEPTDRAPGGFRGRLGRNRLLGLSPEANGFRRRSGCVLAVDRATHMRWTVAHHSHRTGPSPGLAIPSCRGTGEIPCAFS